MIRFVLALVAVAMIGSVVGCHAEGDVDHPRTATHMTLGQ